MPRELNINRVFFPLIAVKNALIIFLSLTVTSALQVRGLEAWKNTYALYSEKSIFLFFVCDWKNIT